MMLSSSTSTSCSNIWAVGEVRVEVGEKSDLSGCWQSLKNLSPRPKVLLILTAIWGDGEQPGQIKRS